MVCSRSGVRLYAATPRSGPGLLCAAARFVSAMYATVSDLPSSRITSLCWKGYSSHLLRVLEQKGIYAVLKNNLSLLDGLEFTPPSSARTKKGNIRTWYVYQHFLFDLPFDEIYVRLLFSLSGVFFTRE